MVTSKCWNKCFWHLFFLTLTFYLWYFFKCLNSYIFIFVNVTEAENTGRKIGMGKSNRNCGDIHALRTVGQQAPWPFANQRWEQFVLSWLRNYPTQIIHFIQCLDWIMNCLHKIFFFERVMRNVFWAAYNAQKVTLHRSASVTCWGASWWVDWLMNDWTPT